MPFPYYYRLSKSDKATYRESDSYDRIELEDPAGLKPEADVVKEALAADDRIAAERAAQKLLSSIARQLAVPRASVRVLDVRPSDAESELHGLYVRVEDEVPVIHVWMRTAAKKHVVAPRTFLRTLLHELCHHLDYELLELEDSFHTEGFFQRESALVRDIAGPSERGKKQKNEVEARPEVPAAPAGPEQLELFR